MQPVAHARILTGKQKKRRWRSKSEPTADGNLSRRVARSEPAHSYTRTYTHTLSLFPSHTRKQQQQTKTVVLVFVQNACCNSSKCVCFIYLFLYRRAARFSRRLRNSFLKPSSKVRRRPLLICSKGRMTIGIKGWAAGWMCRGQTGSWVFPPAPSEPHTQLRAHVRTPEENRLKGPLVDTQIQAHIRMHTHRTHSTGEQERSSIAPYKFVNIYIYIFYALQHTFCPWQ